MKKIKVEKLTPEAFAPYGTVTDIMNPQGKRIGSDVHDFYRDMGKFYGDTTMPVGISPLVVKEHGRKVTSVEYHNHSTEGMMPVNDDAIMHVSLAGCGYDVKDTKAFLVPKGTLITMFPGVYHLMPLPVHEKELHALILLPERAYINDFTGLDLDEDNSFEIEL